MSRVLTSYYRPKPGGLCTRLTRAMQALLARGHTVHYLAVVPFPIDHPRCHFHRYPWPRRRTHGLLFWAVFHVLAPFLLLWLGARHRITHCFAFSSTYAFLLQPARLLLRVPLTVFLRADAIENHRLAGRPPWLLALDTAIEGLGLAGARVLGVSDALVERVRERHRYLVPRLTGTLRNDLPPAPIAAPSFSSSGALRICCAGILEPRKNLSLILEMLAGLPAEIDVSATFYGSGPQSSRLRELAIRLGIRDRVRFAGWRPRAEIYDQNDLLLFPSLHEGAPNTVLEALAAGFPLLASDIPEHREILPAEVLLPPAAPRLWGEHVSRYALPPERRPARLARLALAARPAALRLAFAWDDLLVAAVLRQDGRSTGSTASGARR